MTDRLSPLPVAIPLLNPNEPEGLLAALHVHEGQAVRKGDPLFTLETTKSTADIAAEQDGFIAGLRLEMGQSVRAGELFCYLRLRGRADRRQVMMCGPSVHRESTVARTTGRSAHHSPGAGPGQAIRAGAESLPAGKLITEAEISPAAGETPRAALFRAAAAVRPNGDHRLWRRRAWQIADRPAAPVARLPHRRRGGRRYCAGTTILGLPVLGGSEILSELYAQRSTPGGQRRRRHWQSADAHQSLPNTGRRQVSPARRWCTPLRSWNPAPAVAWRAGLRPGLCGQRGKGWLRVHRQHRRQSYHTTAFWKYVNISPGAILAGEVHVGAGALVGMGATINLQVRIGARCPHRQRRHGQSGCPRERHCAGRNNLAEVLTAYQAGE